MADLEPTQMTPVEDAAKLVADVAAGLASLDAGHHVPYAQVRDWLLSWGAESELAPPHCR